eukprot:gene9865-13272_t
MIRVAFLVIFLQSTIFSWTLKRSYDSPTASTLTLTKFTEKYNSDFDFSDALCNDGSIGGYYFKTAKNPSQIDIFFVYLPGGGQCYDEQSCTDRWEQSGSTHMSSKGFTDTIQKTGILDEDPRKSPLWGVNKAILGYCSSDGYMGDVAASEATWGWHFRGQKLVLAMIHELITKKGLSSTSTIILAGGSAGARGMMTMIDLLVKEYLPSGARVVGFLDSPYYIDINPYPAGIKGFQYQEQQKYLYYNTSRVLSSSCLTDYQPTGEEWKCQFGQYRMNYVNTPYFFIASQYDQYQLELDTQTSPPYSSEITSYTHEFRSLTYQSFQNLILLNNNKYKITLNKNIHHLRQLPSSLSINGYYSWSCYDHDVSDTPAFYTLTVNGVTQRDALAEYLSINPFFKVDNNNNNNNNNKENQVVFYESFVWVENNCSDMNCGNGCNLSNKY